MQHTYGSFRHFSASGAWHSFHCPVLGENTVYVEFPGTWKGWTHTEPQLSRSRTCSHSTLSEINTNVKIITWTSLYITVDLYWGNNIILLTPVLLILLLGNRQKQNIWSKTLSRTSAHKKTGCCVLENHKVNQLHYGHFMSTQPKVPSSNF